ETSEAGGGKDRLTIELGHDVTFCEAELVSGGVGEDFGDGEARVCCEGEFCGLGGIEGLGESSEVNEVGEAEARKEGEEGGNF
ncbi:hypothetical protein OAE90_01875, partial [bacterium]|nr:hypothetical protein [bacterium]